MGIHRHPRTPVIALMAAAVLLPASAFAADAHMAVKAKPGDIVLLRNVSTRPAYRPAPPGLALMVDPSPRSELSRALGASELSDAEYADLGATPVQAGPHQTMVGQMVDSALGSSLGGSNARGGVAGPGVGNLVAGPMGAVGRATGGIGDQVRGALSQMPVMVPATTAGH